MTTKIYTFPEKFAFDEDTSLKVFLRENVDSSVELNAQNLRRIDSLLIQYLIAASRTWRAGGLTFVVSFLHHELGEDLKLLGIDTQTLSWKVAA